MFNLACCDNRVSNSILFFDIAAMIRSILPSPTSRANQSSQKKIKLKKKKENNVVPRIY
jgi:hypothetical protein